jgi:hypothetical protein
MNEERTFIKITKLILTSNNFHLWIEKLKNIAFKIKFWEYINSTEIHKKSREYDYLEISNFDVSNTSSSTISNVVTDLLTTWINLSQSSSFSFFFKIKQTNFIHELNSRQQKTYKMLMKKYHKKKKLVIKFFWKIIKIDEIIRVSIRLYISSKMMSILIKEILQLLIIWYKKRKIFSENNFIKSFKFCVKN